MNINFTKSDRNVLLLYYLFAIPISLHGNGCCAEWFKPLITTFVYVIFSLIALFVIVFVLFPMFFPERKIFTLFIVIVVFISLLGTAELYCYKWINSWQWEYRWIYQIFLSGLESTLENGGMLIGIFLGKKFYDAQLDIQNRETEKRNAELRMLKSQVDPHFLFNNLNTLDSLIDTKPKVAKKYLNSLAALYRYLIQTKDSEVVSLEEEIGFAKKYIYLIEQRFGDEYQFNIEGYKEGKDVFLPPGALQTVLENVVKHNSSQGAEKIITTVKVRANMIQIANNINLKHKSESSSGTGLKNLNERYALLSDRKMQVINIDRFIVQLPLIKMV